MTAAIERRRTVTAREDAGESSPRAAVASPMMDEGRLIGAIAVTTGDRGRQFSPRRGRASGGAGRVWRQRRWSATRRPGWTACLLSARTAQHEVNNRLSLVRGYAEMVADHPDIPDDMRSMLREIIRGASDASEILKKLGKLNELREVEWGPGLRPTLDLRERTR